jgi:hypothetical protein
MFWCPCFAENAVVNDTHKEETIPILVDEIEMAFLEINASRLDVSIKRYKELKHVCQGHTDILYKLHNEGYSMNMHGLECIILRELAHRQYTLDRHH